MELKWPRDCMLRKFRSLEFYLTQQATTHLYCLGPVFEKKKSPVWSYVVPYSWFLGCLKHLTHEVDLQSKSDGCG
jgi:hypothetical protein